MRLAILGKASPWEIFSNLIDGARMVCFYAPRYFHILYHPSLTTHMKKITVMALAAFAASIMASCCCQDQGAPPLTPLPKFNDLNQPAVDVAPVVMKSKK